MKRIIATLFLMLTATVALAGCGKLAITAPETGSVVLGELYRIPTAFVEGREDINIVVTVKDPEGKKVPVSENEFLASIEGTYLVTYSAPGAAERILSVLCSANAPLRQPTPSNVTVDGEGNLNYSAPDEAICLLYVDEKFVREVSPGENILSELPAGNCEIRLSVSGKGKYAESEKSEPLKLCKRMPASDVEVDENGFLTFSGNDYSYTLLLNGSLAGKVESGDNILGKMIKGRNVISVTADPGEGCLRSDPAEYVIKTLFKQVEDFSIDETGRLAFTQMSGFRYFLYVDGEEKTEVFSGFRDPALFDRILVEGNTSEFRLKAISNDPNALVNEEDAFGNIFSVKRLKRVADLSVTDLKLSFTSEPGARYELYVDGVFCGDVSDGADISGNFSGITSSAQITVSAKAALPGYWNAGDSEPLNLTAFDGKYLSANTIGASADESGAHVQNYRDGSSVSGWKLNASAEGTVFRVKESIAFEGDLVDFSTSNYDGDAGVYLIHLRFVDKADENNVLMFSYYLDQNSIATNGAYFGWKYGDRSAGFVSDSSGAGAKRILLANFADNAGGPYGNATLRSSKISYNDGKFVLSNCYGGNADGWGYEVQDMESLDLSGFGTQGVYVEIGFFGIREPASVILRQVGKDRGTVQENQSFSYGNNTSLTGTKFTAKASGTARRFAENIPFAGELLRIGYCNSDGDYSIRKLKLVLTDVRTEEILEISLELDQNVVNNSSVYVGIKFGATDIQMKQLTVDLSDSGKGPYGQLPRILQITVENGIVVFNGGYPGDGWPSGFPGFPDLGNFGENGVSLDVEINSLLNGREGSIILSI